MERLDKGFAPIASPATRIFILGSLPGKRSIGEQRYYAHPTNQFWKLVGSAIGVDLHRADYDERLRLLERHRIGLWDVIDAAEREGSGDHAIRHARTNPIGGLRRDFPDLRAIAFNGTLAAREGMKLLGEMPDIAFLSLPSSSAANTVAIADKARLWAAIAEHVAIG